MCIRDSERFNSIFYFVSLTETFSQEKETADSPVPRPLHVRHVSPPKVRGRRDSSADSDFIPNTPAKKTSLSDSIRSMPARSQKNVGKCVGKMVDSSESESDAEEYEDELSDLDGVEPLGQ